MILVTGGTGLVGSHLLFSLLKSNETIRATYRKNSDLNAVKKVFSFFSEHSDSLFNKIEWVEADLTDIPRLEKALEGIRRVYHCAAYVNFEPKNFQKLKKANVEGTSNLVNLCLSKNIEKLCHVSSIAALGKTLDNSLINEQTPWNPEENNSVYAITKYGAELEVWRGAQEGLSTIIVQPGIILGEGNWHRSSGDLITAVAKGISFYTPGSIGVVDVKDVVSVMIDLMNSDTQNESYILVSDNVTYKVLFDLMAGYFNQKPPKKLVPKWFMKVLGKLDWLSNVLFGTTRRLPSAIIDSMYETTRYDSSKIKEELNFSLRPLPETVERIGANYSMVS